MALIEINWRPDRRRLRRFGWAALVAFAAVGALVWWRRSLPGFALAPETALDVACGLWGLAAACGVLSLAAPAALGPLYVGLSAVGLPIGWVVSHVVLAVIYYGVLTPIGLVMRLVGRDPLHRRFDRSAKTYWQRRPPVDDVKRYFRQF
jgi:hypothetical protein